MPSRQPLLEPLEVEQRSHRGVGVRHREQQLAEASTSAAAACVGDDRHVAVVVAARSARSTRVAPAGSVPSLVNARWFAVDHARRVDLAGHERPGRVALAADVVTVQPDADVEAPHGRSRARLEPGGAQVASGINVACGESTAPVPTTVPRRSADRLDVAVGAHDDDRREVAVGVAHGERRDVEPRRGGQRAGAHPGQRRVPRGVDAAGDELFDLALVVRVQDVVEGEIAGRANQRRKPSQIVTTFGS